MRIIGNFENAGDAGRFSLFLRSKEIENSIEEGEKYQVWVHDEDCLEEAAAFLEDFKKNPQDSKFNVSVRETLKTQEEEEKEDLEEALSRIKSLPAPPKKSVSLKMTGFFFLLCSFIYILNFAQERAALKSGAKYVLLTPVQKLLLYDVPVILVKLDEVLLKYGVDPSQKLSDLPPEAQAEIRQLEETPRWEGIYYAVVSREEAPLSGPLFEKISHGQLWRLVSPSFLHKDFLHILFNMLWLWFLGKQVEEKTSRWRYFFLVMIIAAVSNTAQYLVSGPYFLGYSGVVTGLAGFIWARQKVAPWEGYTLQRSVILFLGFYVLAMLLLQIASFFAQLFSDSAFMPTIANTAHISGAVAGIILGRFAPIAWRPHER